MVKHSFQPIIPSRPRILILGSLPGDASIAQQQYYAHPQNRFWKILFHLFGEGFKDDYTERIALLLRQQIALWDVCSCAYRPGSMDMDISHVVPNDINTLLLLHPTLTHIYFNGQKARKLYDSFFQQQPAYQYRTLPSSSPANARFNFDMLLQSWLVLTS